MQAVIVSRPAAIYSTAFPLTENPISEGSKWLNGLDAGINWLNFRTTPGLAFGTDVSPSPPFNDPTAILAPSVGSFSGNQYARAFVRTINQQAFNQEVALRLRCTVDTVRGMIQGYEVLFRCCGASGWYTDIVRWDGGSAADGFTILIHTTSGPGIANGDLIEATAVGTVIKAFVNGVLVNTWDTANDAVPVFGLGSRLYCSGSPGIGCFQHGQTTATLPDFGLTYFAATNLSS